MRHSPVVSATLRVAVHDVELGGVLIPAGTLVIANTGAANRDPAVYPDPDRLDITRDARRHVAFGFGVHQCLGQPLARMELTESLALLLRELPDLDLTGTPESRGTFVLRGFTSVPVGV